MGCSGSKESRRGYQSPPIAPEPPETDDSKPEALLSASTSTKTADFHTHTTDASSFDGFKGGVRSLPSLGESNPRSDGGSELGSMSLFSASASSKRSGGGGFGFSGEKLSEHSDEEDMDEDFEDDDTRPSTTGEGAAAAAAETPDALEGAPEAAGEGPGFSPLASDASPSRRRTSDAGAPASAPVARCVMRACIVAGKLSCHRCTQTFFGVVFCTTEYTKLWGNNQPKEPGSLFAVLHYTCTEYHTAVLHDSTPTLSYAQR